MGSISSIVSPPTTAAGSAGRTRKSEARPCQPGDPQAPSYQLQRILKECQEVNLCSQVLVGILSWICLRSSDLFLSRVLSSDVRLLVATKSLTSVLLPELGPKSSMSSQQSKAMFAALLNHLIPRSFAEFTDVTGAGLRGQRP